MKKFNFKIRGNKYSVEILSGEDDKMEIEVNGSKYCVEVEREKRAVKTPKLIRPKAVPGAASAKAKTSRPDSAKGAGQIKAPLPGTILEVKIKPGDAVKIDDVLLIMEAMKMENNIKADKSGIVKSVEVKPGDSALEGDVLVEIGE